MKEHIYNILYHPKNNRLDIFIQIIVYLNVLTSIVIMFLETEKSLSEFFPLFKIINSVNMTIFIIEYVLRLYCITATEKYNKPLGRLKYSFSFLMLVDLVVIIPYLFAFIGVDLTFLRGLRILRSFKLFRLAKFAQFDDLIISIFKEKKEEFIFVAIVIFVFLIISSPIVYYFEVKAQPEVFSSMFKTLWWAIITFTTVGYGDMYPITVGGRVATTFITILGIAFYAIPGSIFTASLLEKLNQKKNSKKSKDT